MNLRRSSPLFVSLALLSLAACGPGTAEPVPAISVRLLPTTATMLPGDTRTFVATVGGTRNGTVQWSLEGGDAPGSIASSGLYTAPSVPGEYTLVATSVADPSKSARSKITVQPDPGIVVTVEGGDLDLRPSQTHDFSVLVTGTEEKFVTWSVDEPTGGQIDADGVYVAPLQIGTFTVRATSNVDPTRSGSVKVYVVPRELGGIVSYAGTKTGRIYLSYGRNPFYTAFGGTSIEAPGQFTIPGLRNAGGHASMRLFAFMDTQGTGIFNAALDPSALVPFTFQVDGVANVAITLEDPAATAPQPPAEVTVVGGAQNAYVLFDPVLAPISDAEPQGRQVEAVEGYRVYWSTGTQPGPGENVGSLEIPAGTQAVRATPQVATAGTYAFSVTSFTGDVESAPSPVVSDVVIGASNTADLVSGTVELEGLSDVGTVYALLVQENGGPIAIATGVGAGTSRSYLFGGVAPGRYVIYAFQDADDDGVVDTTESNNSNAPVIVEKLEGSTAVAPATQLTYGTFRTPVLTSYTRYDATNVYTTLYLTTSPVNELPVRVNVIEGPYLALPSGVAASLTTPGRFVTFVDLRGVPPATLGFTLEATFADGSTEARPSEAITVVTDFPVPVSPTGTASATPTFTWNPPASMPTEGQMGLHLYRVTSQNWVPVWSRQLDVTATSVTFNDDGTASELLNAGSRYAWFTDRSDVAGNSGYDLGAARDFTVQ